MAVDFDASEFLAIFVHEATELIETLDAVHSLKASAASQGFAEMSHLRHAIEEILDNIRNDQLQIAPAVRATIWPVS